MGRLYIIPTPIGNLKDITYRSVEVLGSVDLILAEDTRKTGILLKHYSVKCPLRSHHKFNEHREIEKIALMISEGKSVALVSDAGTPGISDPGFMLVRKCLEENIIVETLPGATAFVPALINSGLPSDRFVFEGFLPVKKGRATRISMLANEKRSVVIYESPHRLIKTLTQLADAAGPDRLASVSRELTKIHEENRRGSLSELIAYYNEKPPKGEIVIILGGNK